MYDVLPRLDRGFSSGLVGNAPISSVLMTHESTMGLEMPALPGEDGTILLGRPTVAALGTGLHVNSAVRGNEKSRNFGREPQDLSVSIQIPEKSYHAAAAIQLQWRIGQYTYQSILVTLAHTHTHAPTRSIESSWHPPQRVYKCFRRQCRKCSKCQSESNECYVRSGAKPREHAIGN